MFVLQESRNFQTHLVEVDVHTLQLEVGGAIVAVDDQITSDSRCIRIVKYLHTRAIETVLSRDNLPVQVSVPPRQLIESLGRVKLTRKQHQFGYPVTAKS